MLKLLVLFSGFFLTTSIYSLTATTVDGNVILFSAYEGKKILIVNTASNSRYVSQYADLQQLHQSYSDSLIVLAFPSNSFGNEPKSNAEIKSHCQGTFGVTYTLLQKGNVSGETPQTVYHWLSHQNENGVMNGVVNEDFTKFLIDRDGRLIGMFAANIRPTDSLIVKAITNP